MEVSDIAVDEIQNSEDSGVSPKIKKPRRKLFKNSVQTSSGSEESLESKETDVYKRLPEATE